MVIKNLTSKVVFLDTAPLIYFIEGHSKYQSQLEEIFKLNDEGKFAFITSSITLLEVLVKPIREKQYNLAKEYSDLLTEASGMQIIDVSTFIAVEAAQIRAEYQIKTPDAIQIATSNLFGADYFLTNDTRLKIVKDLKIITLEELQIS